MNREIGDESSNSGYPILETNPNAKTQAKLEHNSKCI